MKKTAFMLSLFLLLLPAAALAAPLGIVPCGDAGEPPCDFDQLVAFANSIIKFLIKIAFSVAAIAFVYVGWLFMTSGDNPGKRSDAIKILWKVFWGFVMMLAAWLIVSLVIRMLGYKGEGLRFIEDIVR